MCPVFICQCELAHLAALGVVTGDFRQIEGGEAIAVRISGQNDFQVRMLLQYRNQVACFQ